MVKYSVLKPLVHTNLANPFTQPKKRSRSVSYMFMMFIYVYALHLYLPTLILSQKTNP